MADRTAIQRIGVIGGGQLAWMIALEAKKLGIDLVVQTPNRTDPAGQAAAAVVAAAVDDPEGTRILAERCAVITFENEFVNLAALERLSHQGAHFLPALAALEPLLNKYTQRQFLERHGLPNPPYALLDKSILAADVTAKAEALGFPLVMKTCRLGYDGQGTFMISSPQDLQGRWHHLDHQPVLLEAFIPFEKELAVMVARSVAGEIAVYPVVETQQVNQVCRRVMAPAAIAETVRQTIQDLARLFIERLQFVGVLGIEFFLGPGETVLINEVAPRTHNSGHYTLDACRTSQFAQQLRAVAGNSLGSVEMTCDRALMVNLLGFESAHHDYCQQREHLAAIPGAQVYWYGKSVSRPGRKLGHVTVCLQAGQDWRAIAQQVESRWYPSENS